MKTREESGREKVMHTGSFHVIFFEGKGNGDACLEDEQVGNRVCVKHS